MSRSEAIMEHAKRCIPGGVNSPVRSFKSVGGVPIVMQRGQGAWIEDVDGQRYVDYVGAWGALILGHVHPLVHQAVTEQVGQGMGFGTPTEGELELALRLCSMVPGVEQVRLVNSGTEAVMTALRLARAITGRPKIIKCIGGYHGHTDALLVEAGSGATTLGIPSSAGVPEELAALTLLVPYNDLSAVSHCLQTYGEDIAALIIEPVAGNMNCVPPRPGYLEGLRSHCREAGVLLIFDEVMTGFRVHPGGASTLYGVTPDLWTFGKIIGGGLPIGAVGGSRTFMEFLAPMGPVYQAGTMSGNPVPVAAGLATLDYLHAHPEVYTQLERYTQALLQGLSEVMSRHGIPFQTRHVGSMFGFFFSEQTALENLSDVSQCDTARFRKFFHGMCREGVYCVPSAFEAGFVSCAHDDATLEFTLSAAERVARTLR